MIDDLSHVVRFLIRIIILGVACVFAYRFAAGAVPGMPGQSLTAAVSPTTKMSGWLGTDRSTPTSIICLLQGASASSSRASSAKPLLGFGKRERAIGGARTRSRSSRNSQMRQVPRR